MKSHLDAVCVAADCFAARHPHFWEDHKLQTGIHLAGNPSRIQKAQHPDDPALFRNQKGWLYIHLHKGIELCSWVHQHFSPCFAKSLSNSINKEILLVCEGFPGPPDSMLRRYFSAKWKSNLSILWNDIECTLQYFHFCWRISSNSYIWSMIVDITTGASSISPKLFFKESSHVLSCQSYRLPWLTSCKLSFHLHPMARMNKKIKKFEVQMIFNSSVSHDHM